MFPFSWGHLHIQAPTDPNSKRYLDSKTGIRPHCRSKQIESSSFDGCLSIPMVNCMSPNTSDPCTLQFPVSGTAPSFGFKSGTTLQVCVERCPGFPPRDSSRHGIWNISGDVGLVSVGRIDKDTPPLTTPSHTSKSSAMDISSHIFLIEIHGATHGRFRRGRCPTQYDTRPRGPIGIHVTCARVSIAAFWHGF